MNDLKKSDLNLSDVQNGGVDSSQKKNVYIQDLQIRFKQLEKENGALKDRLTKHLNSQLQETQDFKDNDIQMKYLKKMLSLSRTKIDQCNDGLSKLCKHQNLMVDVLNKTEEFRINVERKVKTVEAKCRTTINILCSKLQTSIDKQNQIFNENTNLNLELNQSLEININLQKKIENFDSELKQIELEWTEKFSKLSSEKEKIEMENRTLKENYTNIEKQKQEIQEELKNSEQINSQLENNIKEKGIDINIFQETIEKMKKDNNLLTEDVKSKDDKNKNINESLRKLQDELVKKSELYSNLENGHMNLRKEMQLLNDKIVELNKTIILEKQNIKKKENDFNLREQLLREEHNRLIIHLNSKNLQMQLTKPVHKAYEKPSVENNEWDTNTDITDHSDITIQPEKKVNIFSKPSKYISLPSKRTAGKAGFRWSSAQNNKIIKPNTSENNAPNGQRSTSTENIVTSSCK